LTAVFDGRVWPATQALGLGLIDGIQGFDTTFAGMSLRSPTPLGVRAELQHTEEATMPTNEPVVAPVPDKQEATPHPATLADLKGIAGENSAFVVSALERGLTVVAAQTEYIGTLREQLEAERVRAEEQIKAAFVPPATAGGPGLPAGKPAPELTDFISAARVRASEKKIGIADAMSQLARENPEAHKAWIDNQTKVKV
jgi:hypothetical protein